MNPKIYILLPVHNRRAITEKFVDCLVAQSYSNYHLILIDDGSTDGTGEMVKAKTGNLTILRGGGNWWWAGGLQRGLEWLKENVTDKSALILFINDDVHFLPDYLERAIHVMADKNGVLMLSRYKNPDSGEIQESGISADVKRLVFKIATSSRQINCLSTRGLFVHWGDVQGIGGFHPRLLPHYLSDFEYTIRAHRKGFRCETSADLLIEWNDKTTGYHVIIAQSRGEYLKKYFSKRSAVNPIYLSSFVLLTCSPMWVAVNLARIWAGAIRSISKAVLLSGSGSC